jgi:dipeptidyl aminopeptidase/acylaminoacyl peptidase
MPNRTRRRAGRSRPTATSSAGPTAGADRHVGDPEELRYEVDGAEVQGWVLTPPEFDPDGQYPLAVEIHGGPHSMWTQSGSMWHEFQSLAAAGSVVFWCNHRGSVGYGESFATAIERNWGEVTNADVLAGADLVADREYVDADQQFVTGGSFGGYMTAWLIGHTDRFAGAVAQRGVYELSSFYGSTDGAYKLVEGDFDAVPWEEPEFLWERSPATHAPEGATPTLLLHAEGDYRVPICNAELLHRFLRKGGGDTRLVRCPREGHELSRSGEPGHAVDRIERIVRWFDGYSRYHDAPRALDREPNAASRRSRSPNRPTSPRRKTNPNPPPIPNPPMRPNPPTSPNWTPRAGAGDHGESNRSTSLGSGVTSVTRRVPVPGSDVGRRVLPSSMPAGCGTGASPPA